MTKKTSLIINEVGESYNTQKEIVERIYNKSLTFANLNLASQKEIVEIFNNVGIPTNEFEANQDKTANHNFLMNFISLAKSLTEFHDNYNFYIQNDETLNNAENFIYWLAANLFKLNLHIAVDPFSAYEKDTKFLEQSRRITGAMFKIANVDEDAVNALSAAFTLLKDMSINKYIAYLDNMEYKKSDTDAVLNLFISTEKFYNFREFIVPAFVIANAYTDIIFNVGTSKPLNEKINFKFAVDKTKEGYNPLSVSAGFGKRFKIYAGEYADWYSIKENNEIKNIVDIAEFNSNERILLKIESSFLIATQHSLPLKIFTINNQEPFYEKMVNHCKKTKDKVKIITTSIID